MHTFALHIIAIIGTLVLSSPHGHAKEISMKDFLPSYVSIQEALTADELALAQTKAKELQKQTQNHKSLKDVNASLKSFLQTKSLPDGRKEFKKISEPFVKWMESNKDSNFEVVYCPMAGAKWVQKKGEVSNPYFGKEMLRCGEKAS